MTPTSRVLAESPEIDLAVLAAEVEELEEYIVKGEVYRTLRVPTPAGVQQVQMSGGDLLTRLYRLEGERESLPVEQRSRLKDLALQARSTIYSLRTRFHDLLAREVKARIDSLNWFLDDVLGDPKRARTEYPYEIRNRQRIAVMVEELAEDFTPELKAELKRVDERIRLIVQPADFVWDSRLASIFPRERFWYLYVSP
ncbi:MAG TPA: hypothetical protein DCL15_12710 [Chloroflexi bacterium]|nr:hypothetical protein [Chloroflexota bacterium]HHW84753.1 hypothetical protein [Chloroflexota bacterium]